MSNNTERIINHQDGLDLIEQVKGIKDAITAIAVSGGGYAFKSFAELQQLVRNGLAQKVLSIGDQIVVSKESAVSAVSTNSGLTITVDANKFIEKIGEAGNKDYEATFDGIEWHDEHGNNLVLSTFGIAITAGTPVEGDKIVVHETATDILFDVADFDYETPEDTSREHSLTLVMHHTFTGVQFDAPEALWYFPNGLPAGSYAFTIGSYDNSYGGNNTYYFTLANAIPAKGQIRFNWGYQNQAASCKIQVFASATATSVSEEVSISTTEISGAPSLGTVGNGTISTDSSVTVGGTAYAFQANNIEAARYGKNVWAESAIRQFMNSDKAKGTYWKPMNVFDRPPSWASTLDGFWYGIDPSFKSACGVCVKKTNNNNKTHGSGQSTTKDLAWAVGMGELGVTGNTGEGAQYAYFKKIMNGVAIADWSIHAELIKTNTGGSAQYWWLRSPGVGDANYARFVRASGHVYSHDASDGRQAVVALSII